MGPRRGQGGRARINAHALLAQRHTDNFAPNGLQSGGAEHWRFGLLPSAQSPHLLHFAHRAQRHGGIAIGRFGGGDLRDQLGTAQQSARNSASRASISARISSNLPVILPLSLAYAPSHTP